VARKAQTIEKIEIALIHSNWNWKF